jgi:ferredoxin-NADP reductase
VRATIKEKQEIAQGTLLVKFDLGGEDVEFEPGQYFFVTLLDPPYDDDRGPRRHITVVTSPNERGVLGLATRLRDSAFKKSLQELPIGTEVEVEPPKGKFTLPEDVSGPLVFVAGGIGITVFRVMLRYIDEESLPYSVTLLFSNRNGAEAAFLDELRELERRISGFRLVLTMTDDPEWEGERRRIDAGFFRHHVGDALGEWTFMVAGPPPMVAAMQEELASVGVPEERVLAEKYSGY